MIVKVLYKGGGISFSPIPGEGRINSGFVRLFADEGKILTNYETTTTCVDVREDEMQNWDELDENEVIDNDEVLSILMGENV